MEFGIVVSVFLTILFGILELSMYFLCNLLLDRALYDASRYIQTGQAQKAGYNSSNFIQKICDNTYMLISCSGMTVDVRVYSTTTSPNIAYPIDSGKNFISSSLTYQMGGPSDIVVAQVFYQYPLFFTNFLRPLGLNIANLSNGKRLVMSVVAFQNEPY